jgi:MFS family permease
MVIVNTVVIVKDTFGGDNQSVALFFAAYGIGSIVVALSLPRLSDRFEPRAIMLAGGFLLPTALVTAALLGGYWTTLVIWTALGAGASLVQTPAGILLRRSSHP